MTLQPLLDELPAEPDALQGAMETVDYATPPERLLLTPGLPLDNVK
jgi:hypothetical protein